MCESGGGSRLPRVTACNLSVSAYGQTVGRELRVTALRSVFAGVTIQSSEPKEEPGVRDFSKSGFRAADGT